MTQMDNSFPSSETSAPVRKMKTTGCGSDNMEEGVSNDPDITCHQ